MLARDSCTLSYYNNLPLSGGPTVGLPPYNPHVTVGTEVLETAFCFRRWVAHRTRTLVYSREGANASSTRGWPLPNNKQDLHGTPPLCEHER